MKYGTFLKVNKRFQTSVNLEYDLNRFDKLKSYIPTEQSVKILDAFLRSVYYTNEGHRRATVLIGPYGRGKSHLLLVLIALTSLDVFFEGSDQLEEARTIQLELIEKISTVDANVGELARSILESGTRLLPLIINSNTNDINQAFIIALRDSLEIAGLQSLLPETYFDTAYAVITKWETSIPSAYKKLSQEIRKHKRTVEDLRIGLKQFNQESYQLFCQCYPQIAAGAEFNPLMNMDVIKLYLSVTNALHEQTRFSGIHIVFDEFSKFLEANLDKSRMLNFKIIQDTAEAATRSGEQQFHFTCITHKDILDYSSSDSFKTVEGRFQKVRFVASSEQSYELIANAIEKTEEFDGFVKKYQKDFTKAIDYTSAVNVFGDLNEAAFMKKLIYGCFPLSPLSSFSLLRVSELVGQNERTLFTFIARNDEHTLARFIQKDYPTVTFLMMDTIFDYFEELFKKEMFNTSVHSIWAKTDSAIRQVSDSTQMKILKAIAIIKMIADDRLKAIPAHIKAALMMDDQDFDKAVKVLLKKYILTQRDTNELVLLTSNGVDIQKSITGLVKSKVSRIHICDVLSGAVELGFVLPREYNDHYSMLRYFKKVFVEAKDFLLFKNTDQILSNYPYDGLLIYIIQSNDSLNQEIQDKIQSYKGYPQIILCMSRKPFVYEELLKKLVAIQMLKDSFDTQLDSHYLEEVEIIEEDTQKQIQNGINEMFEPSSPYSYFQNCDGLFEVISRQVELNREISNICSRCYHLTPIINNEMVNKNVITSPIIKARDTVINWILDHADANAIPCMDGYGPEVSIFKSVFNRTGLNRAVTIEDPGMNVVLEQIGRFIAGCESKRSDFPGIYQTLTSKPYGLRKGIIPLLFAYMLRQYKENAVFYFSGKEVELSAFILRAYP